MEKRDIRLIVEFIFGTCFYVFLAKIFDIHFPSFLLGCLFPIVVVIVGVFISAMFKGE